MSVWRKAEENQAVKDTFKVLTVSTDLSSVEHIHLCNGLLYVT